MVRMKLRDDEFDEKALDVKVEPSKFKRYTGDVPKTGTILIARVTKLWWTQSEAGNSMIRVMAIAEKNIGDKKKFNGLPIREYLVFTPESAWRYMPFLNNFGLTIRDIKRKMNVEPEPDTIGDVITSISDWEVGSDDALCRIVINRERYEDDFNAKVDRDGWLPLDEDDEPDDDDEDDDDEEEDEQPARPRRGRSTQAPARGAKAASGRTRKRPEPEPEDEDEDDEDIDDEDDEDLDDDADEVDEDEDDDAEEEEDQEEDDEDEPEEPPARPARRSRNKGGTTAARPAATRSGGSRRGTATTRSADGGRTRSGGTKSRTSSRAASSKSSKGDDSDPPF